MSEELVLEFEPDIEVRVRLSPVSTDEFFTIRDLWDDGTWAERASLTALYDAFGPLLVSWTLSEPTTAEGLRAIDMHLAIAIVGRWIKEVRKVPGPLPRRSSDPASEDPSQEPSSEPDGSDES